MQSELKTPKRGMFEWDLETVKDPESTADLIEKFELTHWYQEFPKEETDIPKFVDFMHQNKVSVYALLGSQEWGFEADGASLITELQKIVYYNASAAPSEKIIGVMLDIEPYVTKRWKAEPESSMKTYVDGMIAAYESVQGKGLQVVICIPRHYDDSGLSAELERLIANACEEVAIMNYDCGNEVEKIKTEAGLALKYNKELHCILEFQKVGKHGLVEEKTYNNKGINAANEAFKQVENSIYGQTLVWDYHYARPIKKCS